MHCGPNVGLTTRLWLLLLLLLNFMYVCVCACVNMYEYVCELCVCKYPRKPESIKSPETEITDSCEWVLGTELKASERVGSTFT